VKTYNIYLIMVCAAFAFGCALTKEVLASIPIEQAATSKKEHYLKEGVFVGGVDKVSVKLLNVRHSYQPETHFERLVLDILPTQKISGNVRPGFFHVAIRKSLIIDLSDCDSADVTAAQVSRVLSRSHYFEKAEFALDEHQHSLTLEIPLKNAAQYEVFELSGVGDTKASRIVIDAKSL
jgi:hypothetical protein